jgi:PleD family two-component response regulator
LHQKILIVDDSSFNIDALMIILKYVYKIKVDDICSKAFDGQQALNIIKNNIE